MSKTKIEWCDYTINPVKGLCPMACEYCYARRMYKRFKWNPEIHYDPGWYHEMPSYKNPSRVFIGSTMEIFGDWVKDEWVEDIMMKTDIFPQHTFIFLTKKPENFQKYSPFPDNCWVGVSVVNDMMRESACQGLDGIDAKVKFISFEPLMGDINTKCICGARYYRWLDWLIIGQQTPAKAATIPKVEWIRDIVEAADSAGIPVFLKDNLRKLLPGEEPFYTIYPKDGFMTGHLRQEFPNV